MIQPAGEANRGEEFVLGPLKVIPNPSAAFARRHRLGLYLEVYDLGLDQTSGKPSVEVSYTLVGADGRRLEIGRELESRFEEGSTLAISKAIPLEKLAPGGYRVAVRVADLVTGRRCTLEGKVTVR